MCYELLNNTCTEKPGSTDIQTEPSSHGIEVELVRFLSLLFGILTLQWNQINSLIMEKKIFFTNQHHLKLQSNPVISRAVNSRKSVSRGRTLDPKF